MPWWNSLADPGSAFWQWCNIVLGLFGVISAVAAAVLAKSANEAAWDAAQAAHRSADRYSLHDLREALIEVQSLLQFAESGPLVAQRANLIKSHVHQLRARIVLEDRRSEAFDRLIVAIGQIGKTAIQSNLKLPTKHERVLVALDQAMSEIGTLIGINQSSEREELS